MAILSNEQLEELRQFDTPTISNAIELFNVRPRTQGFMGPEIKCIVPYDKPIIGYAVTAKMSALKPPTPEQNELLIKYYEKVKETTFPTISVIQDIDPSPIGSFWGDIQASIHKALGCVGVITNGGVRDLDGVKEIDFRFFASCVLVSHAYDHLEEINCPVYVGGLTVYPGELLYADKHGVISIPHEVAPKLAEACKKVQSYERVIIDGCRRKFDMGINIQELIRLRKEMEKLRDM
ncbi:MAG TPA: RraA family protein [Thermoanaerobacterales bacterium]|nr:RraA family protein [Thermoanaerobacterales bacterium]